MAYRPEQYIHDLDARAFDMLNTFPKAVKLFELYKAGFDEKESFCPPLSVLERNKCRKYTASCRRYVRSLA